MIIPIDSRYRIAADRHSWTVQRRIRRKHRKTGELVTEWKSIMWLASLQQAVRELAELRLRTSDAETVADALAEVQRVVATLCSALQSQFAVRIRAGPKESPVLDEAKPGEKNTKDSKRAAV